MVKAEIKNKEVAVNEEDRLMRDIVSFSHALSGCIAHVRNQCHLSQRVPWCILFVESDVLSTIRPTISLVERIALEATYLYYNLP